MKLQSPYCVSFKELPDHPEAIPRIRKLLKKSRHGFKTQMAELTDTLLKGEYDNRLVRKIQK